MQKKKSTVASESCHRLSNFELHKIILSNLHRNIYLFKTYLNPLCIITLVLLEELELIKVVRLISFSQTYPEDL